MDNMTKNRKKVLAYCESHGVTAETRPNYANMARECHLFSYREARRTFRDLKKAGYLSAPA